MKIKEGAIVKGNRNGSITTGVITKTKTHKWKTVVNYGRDEDVEVETHALNSIPSMIANGTIRDAKSIAGLLQVIHGVGTLK